MQYCSIYITTGDEDEARRIGKTLVEEKLAACVNILPIKSIYRWEDDIVEEGEFAMFIKTRAGLAERVIERAKELHSYEVPCIVSFPIEKGNPDYLKWIDESTE
ncbi:MAG: divalent-cation tolerance protein CutA [Dehalococcoidales bacterium]|nr:divalent-cation tolerance protein CutA [Dehalococcoidales bacterium]